LQRFIAFQAWEFESRSKEKGVFFSVQINWLPVDLSLGVRLQELQFLGAFAKLRKPTIGFVKSVCPSARKNSAPTRRIFVNSYLSMVRKSVGKIQDLLKSDKNNRYFTRRPVYIFYHSILLRM